jgi:hypothetical protein
MKRRVRDEGPDGFRIGAGVLAQSPANGLVDKELLRVQILADDIAQQGKIGIGLVVKLEEDGGTAQLEVGGLAPVRQVFAADDGITPEVHTDSARGDGIDGGPTTIWLPEDPEWSR